MYRSAYCLEEYRVHLDKAADSSKREEDTERLFTKLPVILGIGDIARSTEKTDNKARRKLEEQCCEKSDYNGTAHDLTVQLLDSIVLFSAHIEADDGLTTKYDSNDEVKHECEHLALYSDNCNRDVCAVL